MTGTTPNSGMNGQVQRANATVRTSEEKNRSIDLNHIRTSSLRR